MDSHVRWLLLAVLAIIGFLVVYGFICHFYFKTPQFSLWIHNCLQKKTALARNIDGRKIVLLSGSNTLFGISATEIEARTGIPTVNMAVHYGLQIDYMTENVKGILRPGDILIMPLEYHHYSYNGEYSLVQSCYIRTYDRDYYNRLPLPKRLRHLINTTPLDLLKSMREQLNFKGVESPAGRGIYNSQNLSANGDEFSLTEPLLDRLDREQPLPIKPVSEHLYGFANLIEFSKWCREHGVKLFVTWPNTLRFEKYDSDDYSRYFQHIEKLLRRNGIAYFGDRTKSFFEKKYMYDGFYHLNTSGIKRRTTIFISEMKENVGL